PYATDRVLAAPLYARIDARQASGLFPDAAACRNPARHAGALRRGFARPHAAGGGMIRKGGEEKSGPLWAAQVKGGNIGGSEKPASRQEPPIHHAIPCLNLF